MSNQADQDLLKESEEMVARIIALLAQNGVKRVDVEILSLGFEGSTDSDITQYVGLFNDAMEWLIAENIIRHTDKDMSGTYYECCITSYGFALLGQKFIGTNEGETVGKAVKNISENNAGYSKLGELLGGILGSFTKSIGG